MQLKKLLRKVIISAAAVCMAAAMTVTSFAANPENLPTGSGGTLPGTINVTPETVTPGQIYTPTTEKEDRSGTKYQPGKYTNNIPEEERTTIHFKLANDSMASGTMKDYIAAKNSSFQLPECGFKAKKGYSFVRYVGFGENSARPGEYISIGDADEYWIWACFERIEYTTINFKSDWHEFFGKNDSENVEKGSTYKLPECMLTPRHGYDFDYWETPLGNVKPGYSIQIGYEDEYTFYARGKKVSYVNLIMDNGLTGSKHETYKAQLLFEVDKNKNVVVTLPKLKFKAVEGYKFNKWLGGKPGEKFIVDTTDYHYDSGTPTIYAEPEKIKVKMSDCSISIKSGDWKIYKGKAITPEYTVTDKYGITLEEGVDFKAVYSNNDKPGKSAEITLTGINGNTGTKKAYFTIKPPQMSLSSTLGGYIDKDKKEIAVTFFDPNIDKMKKVEIQLSTDSGFEEKSTYSYKFDFPYICTYKEIKTYVDGQRVKLLEYKCSAKLPSYEKGKVWYVRSRYIVGGVKGEWTMRNVKVK